VGGSPGLDPLTDVGLSSLPLPLISGLSSSNLPLISGLSLPLVTGFSEPTSMGAQGLLANSVPPAPTLQGLRGEGMGEEGSMSPPPSSEPRGGQKDSKAEVRRARRSAPPPPPWGTKNEMGSVSWTGRWAVFRPTSISPGSRVIRTEVREGEKGGVEQA